MFLIVISKHNVLLAEFHHGGQSQHSTAISMGDIIVHKCLRIGALSVYSLS